MKMTDEEIRALCVSAAVVEHARCQGMGGGGPSLLAEAKRLFDWVKTGSHGSSVPADSSGGGGGASGWPTVFAIGAGKPSGA